MSVIDHVSAPAKGDRICHNGAIQTTIPADGDWSMRSVDRGKEGGPIGQIDGVATVIDKRKVIGVASRIGDGPAACGERRG